jgi:hypothetical protein
MSYCSSLYFMKFVFRWKRIYSNKDFNLSFYLFISFQLISLILFFLRKYFFDFDQNFIFLNSIIWLKNTLHYFNFIQLIIIFWNHFFNYPLGIMNWSWSLLLGTIHLLLVFVHLLQKISFHLSSDFPVPM